MAADISAKIGIDGEKAFRDSLGAINSQMKALNSEMKAVVSEFSGMENSEEAVAAKTNVLEKSIDAANKKLSVLEGQSQRAKNKLNTLADELENARREFGENSVEAERAQNAYNRQVTVANKLESQISQTRAEISKMEREMRDAGKAADDMGDDLQDAGRGADLAGASFKGAFAGGAVLGAVQAIASAVSNLAAETVEYNKILGTLETSSQKAGYTLEETEETYKQLYGVLGDSQTAATAAANLQALGLAQEDLKRLTDGAIGAWATYGDSIPIDGLAEAINETVKVGQATGTFADVLNWASGVTEDTFNAELEQANSLAERANIVMQELARQGLVESAEGWRQNNDALLQMNLATAKVEQATGRMGEMFMPVVATIKGGIAGILLSFLDLVDGARTGGIAFVENVVEGISSNLPQVIASAGDTVVSFIEGLSGNFGEVLASGLEMLGELIKGIISAIPELVKQLPRVITALTGFIRESAPQIILSGVGIIMDVIKGIIQAIPQLVANLPLVMNAIVEGFLDLMGAIKDVGKGVVEGLWEGIKAKSQWLKNKIKDVIDSIKAAFTGSDGFDVHSPSKWSMGVTNDVMEGAAIGFAQNKNALKEAGFAVDTLKSQMENAMVDISGNMAPNVNNSKSTSYTYGDTVVYVDNLNASNQNDIQRLAYNLEFYRRQIATGKGGA